MKNTIKEEIQKTKQLKEYAKNMLCISIIVFIIQAIVVILNGRYYGNIFEKLQQFYSDKSIYLKARAVPVFVFINFFGYIYNIIKLKRISKNKSSIP